MADMHGFIPLFHGPMLVVGLFGTLQSWGIRRGKEWAFSLGIPVHTHEERYPVRWTPELLQAREEDSRREIMTLRPGEYAIVDWSLQMSGRTSGGGVRTSGGGLVGYAILRVIDEPGGTLFQFERRVGLFGPTMVVGMSFALHFGGPGAFAREPSLVLSMILAMLVFLVVVCWIDMRKLMSGFHVWSTDIMTRTKVIPQQQR